MDILSQVVAFALSIVSAVLIFILQSKIKENQKLKREKAEIEARRESALENGVVCLLRKELIDEHAKYMAKGYISSKALESGLLMYKAYKALGGNGMIDHMEEEIERLPIRD